MVEVSPSKSSNDSIALKQNPFDGLSEEAIIESVLDEHKPSRNPFVRGLWITVGSIGVLFAVIGIFVPGWPTTSWLVLSAYCYARSSKKLFKWLLTNRLFGAGLLEYYRTGRSLPFHSKVVIGGIICIASIYPPSLREIISSEGRDSNSSYTNTVYFLFHAYIFFFNSLAVFISSSITSTVIIYLSLFKILLLKSIIWFNFLGNLAIVKGLCCSIL